MPVNRKRIWSLELVIVIAIPVATVIAGFITLALAQRDGFRPTAEQVDRFAQPQQSIRP